MFAQRSSRKLIDKPSDVLLYHTCGIGASFQLGRSQRLLARARNVDSQQPRTQSLHLELNMTFVLLYIGPRIARQQLVEERNHIASTLSTVQDQALVGTFDVFRVGYSGGRWPTSKTSFHFTPGAAWSRNVWYDVTASPSASLLDA